MSPPTACFVTYLPTCTVSLHNPLPIIGSATVGGCWRGLALGLFSTKTAIDGKERADSAEEEVATGLVMIIQAKPTTYVELDLFQS